jgi:RNA polymerase sigma factor (sigma-70 family)
MTHESEREQLDAEFREILNPGSPTGLSLFASVKHTLVQFHLIGLYSEACIINEAYLRAIKLIEQGKTIRNPLAWSRRTAYNHIQELNRAQRKLKPFDENQSEVEQVSITDTEIEEDFTVIQQAFQMLKPKHQEILKLYVIEGLSWQEVRNHLAQRGENRTETALRKVKERALKQLRKHYHFLKTEPDSPQMQKAANKK